MKSAVNFSNGILSYYAHTLVSAMFHVPEKWRLPGLSSPEKDGNNGWFQLGAGRNVMNILASDGLGWEHVSVSKKYECPTWGEMCRVKELFWDDEDTVVQYHPPKSLYVNNHPHCLHLWRPTGTTLSVPHTYLVGHK